MTLNDNQSDEYFPRGGTGVTKQLAKKRTFAFGNKDIEAPKKKKLGRRERKKKASTVFEFDNKDEDKVKFVRVEPLVYKGLSEGTLAFCSVREIYNNYVDICMPSRLSARLYVENVSEPFNEVHKMSDGNKNVSSLKNIFHIGQHLTCSVLSVKNTDHYLVRVSTNPRHINNHMAFDYVGVGSLIQMAVQSSEDHGYMMYSGIEGLTSFLPTENAKSYINTVRNFKPLDIGQILWCLVTKSKLSESSNTVHVTIDLEQVQNNKIENDISIEKLNPGVRAEVTINKIVSQNLMVTVADSEIHGYIEPSQLGSMWSKPEDYRIGSKHTATVLYKFPYPRVVALTLKSNPSTISKDEIEHGTIFKRAEIMAILKRGVALKLEHNNNVYKGILSVRRLGPDMNYEKLSTMFPLGNHVKCRVIGYDALEQVYSCTTEDNILVEKYLSPNDLKLGEIVEVTIVSIKKGGLEVSIGEVRGFVPRHHISDVLLHNPLDKFKLHSKQKAKVLRIENNNVVFTLRPTLVKTKSLLSFKDLNVGDFYFGTIKKIQPDSITVSFFGDLFIHIHETNMIESPNKHNIGELVKCYVVEVSSHNKLPIFSLLKSVQRMDVTVGKKYDVRVKHISKGGMKCLFIIKDKPFNGFIPLLHMSDHKELCETVMKKYPHYSVIKDAILFSVTDNKYTFSLRKSVATFFEKHAYISGGFDKLKENMIIPASVSEVSSERILVSVPVPGFNGKVPVEKEDLPQDSYEYDLDQELLVKITSLNPAAVEMKVTCNLSDKEKIEWSISSVENFLRTVEPFQCVKVGTELECTVREVAKNYVKVDTEFNIPGIIRSRSLNKLSLEKDKKVKAVVLYHDVVRSVIYLISSEDASKMYGKLQTHLINHQIPGTLLFGTSVFLILMVQCPKGGQIAFVPTKEDPNISNYTVLDELMSYTSCKVTLRLAQTSEKINYWIGLADSFKKKQVPVEDVLIVEDIDASPPSKKSKKKTENSDADPDDLDHDEVNKSQKKKLKKKKRKSTSSEVDSENSVKKMKTTKTVENLMGKNTQDLIIQDEDEAEAENLTLENIGGFNWDATPADLAKVISGSIEEDDDLSQDSDEEKLPLKKMTPAEKRAAALEAEKKIRLKEEELLQAEQNPETPEHFERLLLGHPNSSKFWIMYMAHHLEATEIDKARAVAKRAIKQINARFEEERLNVWIAMLNLEHLYGTPELFKEVLTEALKYNDEYEVYTRVLDIYAESKKTAELENLTYMLIKKYKEKIDCWLKCQSALMEAKMHDKSRNYLQRSLKALPPKNHCTLISRFALIENQNGFPEQAQALFENLLTSYPKRVDLWFVYVDMLVKSGSPDLARNVLERATSHKLPVRKMKALYQKWLKLEETHGTPESVQQVKDAANDYVNNLMDTLKQPS
ncbi:rRNA biogenesis protein RRP5 [Halyomorpha halys]|uniref:rRNA biogenesis protein RRP5 n=1 Tax=Halyomorpha halys TaxID=286706 RepID=UPI0006D4FCA6|nr:protein RRP5 homolog [Halyomorpha halys]